MSSKTQLEIDFTPGLVEQFPRFIDCVKASVYGCGKPFKSVAADVGFSPSGLSRRFAENPGDKVDFPLKKLPALIEATRDLTPIYWLIEKYLEDSDAKQRRALEVLAQFARDLPKLMKNAGVKS